jgi:2,3,4,5-tetrahydropyridine-2-carboxylate N-succinyltransferase
MLKETIEQAWDNRELLKEESTIIAIRETIELLDKGEIRICDKQGDDWMVNDWVKKAVVLYFPICKMETFEVGPMEFYDKIPLKIIMKSLELELFLMVLLVMVHFLLKELL